MFSINFHLSKIDAISCSPSTNYMKLKIWITSGGRWATFTGTTNDFEVNSYNTSIFLADFQHPMPKNTFEIFRIQSTEKTIEGIVAEDRLQSEQPFAEKSILALPESSISDQDSASHITVVIEI